MSRKITSLLALLLMMFSMSAFAQDSEFHKKSVTVGGALEEFEPNTWYFLHQSRILNTNAGTHSEIGMTPTDGGFMYDNGIGNDVLKSSLDDVPEGCDAEAKAAYMVRFIESEENEGAYLIQFGTGNYLSAGSGSKFTTSDSQYDAGEYNVYTISVDGELQPGHIGINVWDMGGRFDNNGVGYTVVTWGSGEITSINGNNDWAIHEAIFEEVSDEDAALSYLTETVNTYRDYQDTFTAGTEPGQYSQTAIDAFDAAIAAGDIDDPNNNFTEKTADEIRQLAQDIIDAYNAVLASKVPMTLADGYYRIRAALQYTTTETIVDEETLEEEEIVTEFPKYMSAVEASDGSINARWGTPEDLSTDCPSLWYIAAKDGNFDLKNVAFEARFTRVSTSAQVKLSTASDSLMAFDPVVTLDGTTYIAIRQASQPANGFFYLHQGGHQGGAGVSGNIVGWSTNYDAETETFSASDWYLEPVSAEEAASIIEAYAPFREREAMLMAYDSIMTNAKEKLEIARDIQTNIFDEEGKEMITDALQLTSPYTDAEEGSIEALLDGDLATFWHSNWHDGNAENGTHYLQIEMPETKVTSAAIRITRRNNQSDQITEYSIYGSNDAEAAKEDCELLLTESVPFNRAGEVINTNAFETKGYTYLRIYAENTTNSRGYWHMAELQMYPAEIVNSETTQAKVMGDIFTNLDNVVNEQADLETDDIQEEQFNALKSAYDAFIAVFVDPTALRNKLEETADVASVIVTGTNPGYWSSSSSASALQATHAAATAYDAAGKYTAEQSENYIKTLSEQVGDIYSAANKIQTGKWYRIRFGTEEEYEANGWDHTAGEGTKNEDLGITLNEELFGKYVTATYTDAVEYDDAEGNTKKYYEVVANVSAEDLGMGSNLHLDADEDIAEKDLSLFRFIALGDTTFILQNKGTNLFVRANNSGTGSVTLSPQPSQFTVRAIGYGENVIHARGLDGDSLNYLHAQVASNVMVTWNAFTPGSRSGLFIEEAEDVAAGYVGEEFNAPVVRGAVNTFCYPVEITNASEGTMYGVNGVDEGKVLLTKIETAQAGRPFIYVLGEATDYDPEYADDTEMAVFKHGYAIDTVLHNNSMLKGTFVGKTVGRGKIVAEGNALVVSKKSNTAVGANQAYISGDEEFDPELSVIMVVVEDEDGIETALANVSKSGAVYTVDGRLVSKKATLNDLRKMGKGMYILNGTKVLVK